MTLLNQKELGTVLTPRKTAEYIISKVGPFTKNYSILDPCVGPGVFVEILLNKGVHPNQIHAYDINPQFRQRIEEWGITFKNFDTLLSINSDSYNRFDIIVGNPPYLNKSSSYVRNHRKELRKAYGHINAHETYSMFIVNSIWRLKEGGKLGFITSDSFLTLSTHRKLRTFILENCIINEIILAPNNLFSNQGVSTNPVIIILTKCTRELNANRRNSNLMKVIPRVENEKDYQNPKNIYQIRQLKYKSLPFKIFFITVEEKIVHLFEEAPKLEDYIKGYIGMHSHNNKKYIAALEGTDLADIFRKRNSKILTKEDKYSIISKEEIRTGDWKAYLKRGGGDQYYRPIMEAIKWDDSSIQNYDIPSNVPFEKEGVVISGVSSRLAARYMPKGCYWDSNKAIGFIVKDDSISLSYFLGLLNSSLYNYLAKGIINNTSSIQISGIHALPLVIPDDTTKNLVEREVNDIVRFLRKNHDYNYVDRQKKIDKLIFNLYADRFNLPEEIKLKLDAEYSIYP